MTRTPSRIEAGLRAALAAVALAGVGVATYLTSVRLSGGTPACAIATGCAEVQESAYSGVAGVPVATLGLLAYVALLATTAMRGDLGRIGGLFTAIVGAGFSAWLTYVEIGIIDAICTWCVISAILMGVALALAIARVATSGDAGATSGAESSETIPLPATRGAPAE